MNYFIFKGTKGRHSNVKIEEPTPAAKKEVEKTEIPAKNEPEQTELFVPPDSNQITDILIFESASLKNLPPMNLETIMICKNCKKEKSVLDLNSACHYHKGVQM